MLSKPNVNEMIKKAGNRYEVVIAVAKRARDISNKRLREGSKDITDAIEVASNEIMDGEVTVKSAKMIEDTYYIENDASSDSVYSDTESLKNVINDIDLLNSEINEILESEKTVEAKENIFEEDFDVEKDKKAEKKVEKTRKPRSKKSDE